MTHFHREPITEAEYEDLIDELNKLLKRNRVLNKRVTELRLRLDDALDAVDGLKRFIRMRTRKG